MATRDTNNVVVVRSCYFLYSRQRIRKQGHKSQRPSGLLLLSNIGLNRLMETVPTFAQEAAIPEVQPAIFTKIEAELPIPNFDPAVHLNYRPPPARYSFTKLGLPVPKGCPDLCYTEPFQLFSEEGVRMIRREVFRREFLDKYMRSWERAPCLISGHYPVKNVCDSTSRHTSVFGTHDRNSNLITHSLGWHVPQASNDASSYPSVYQLGVRVCPETAI